MKMKRKMTIFVVVANPPRSVMMLNDSFLIGLSLQNDFEVHFEERERHDQKNGDSFFFFFFF